MNEERTNVTLAKNFSNNNTKEVNMEKTTRTVFITENEVPSILYNNVSGAEFFTIDFTKADGSPRKATAQLHVSNPRNEAITPKGTGESAQEALKCGRIKFYEPHHPGDKEGVYRQCRIDRVHSMKIRGVLYKVIH